MARRRFDFYETPPHYVEALQRVIGVPAGPLVEPCAGHHAIINMLKVNGVWMTNDINRKRATHFHGNAALISTWRTLHAHGPFNWGITNPPFDRRLMLPIVRHMLKFCQNVAVLARLSFLEPTIDRMPFWARWASMCEVIVLPRYSFKRVNGKRQTDSVTCCWLVWRKHQPQRQFFVSSLQEHKA